MFLIGNSIIASRHQTAVIPHCIISSTSIVNKPSSYHQLSSLVGFYLPELSETQPLPQAPTYIHTNIQQCTYNSNNLLDNYTQNLVFLVANC